MKAKEKIYLTPLEYMAASCQPQKDNTVEYTRTDVFVEKACDAYCKVCGHYVHSVPTHICRNDCVYFKDFRKYIEG